PRALRSVPARRSSALPEGTAPLAARGAGRWPGALAGAVAQVRGGYAIAALTPEGIFAVRDPHGIRPLVLGRLDGAYLLASETCALDAVGAEVLREVEPGEWLWIDRHGLSAGRLPGSAARGAF